MTVIQINFHSFELFHLCFMKRQGISTISKGSTKVTYELWTCVNGFFMAIFPLIYKLINNKERDIAFNMVAHVLNCIEISFESIFLSLMKLFVDHFCKKSPFMNVWKDSEHASTLSWMSVSTVVVPYSTCIIIILLLLLISFTLATM